MAKIRMQLKDSLEFDIYNGRKKIGTYSVRVSVERMRVPEFNSDNITLELDFSVERINSETVGRIKKNK